MSRKKLTIEQLKIKSFVTSGDSFDAVTIKGGKEEKEIEVSVRVVAGGCYISEPGGTFLGHCMDDPKPKKRAGIHGD